MREGAMTTVQHRVGDLPGACRAAELTGGDGVVNGLADIAGRRRLGEVGGGTRPGGGRGVGVHRLQVFADFAVQADSAGGRELLVERVADERMGEPEGARGVPDVADDARRGGVAGGGEQVLWRT